MPCNDSHLPSVYVGILFSVLLSIVEEVVGCSSFVDTSSALLLSISSSNRFSFSIHCDAADSTIGSTDVVADSYSVVLRVCVCTYLLLLIDEDVN